MSTVIPKPQLRGLLERSIKRALGGAVIGTLIVGASWYYFVLERRRQRIINFYKTYDPKKAFETACNSGYMESCGPHIKIK